MKLELHHRVAATATILTSDATGGSSHAEVLSISGRRLSLICDLAVPVGTPLQIQFLDYLLMAETVTLQDSDRVMVLQIHNALRLPDIEQIRQKWV